MMSKRRLSRRGFCGCAMALIMVLCFFGVLFLIALYVAIRDTSFRDHPIQNAPIRVKLVGSQVLKEQV